MTTTQSKSGAVLYEAESAWGENVNTYTTRLPILDMVDLSGLMQEKIESGRVVQRRNDGTAHIQGPQSGSFKTRLYLTGHGSATSSTTSLTSLGALLGVVFGASAVSASSGTTFTGGTASAPTTTASGTFSAGSLCRAGVGGISTDSRGSGQFAAISTHSTTTLNLLTALPAAPNNADVLHSAETFYADDSAAVQSCRFRLMTAGQQIDCHGCFASAVSIGGLNAGEVPFVEVTWTVSWWEFKAATFPVSTSVETFAPAPVGSGSVFIQTAGTATRATISVRDFTIDYTLGVAPLMAPNGTSEYQTIAGAVRTPDSIKVSFTDDADSATTTPTQAARWLSTNELHLLYTLNPTAGSAVAFYFPRLCVIGTKPTQSDRNGVNSVTTQLAAYTGTTTTSALTLSAMRGALA